MELMNGLTVSSTISAKCLFTFSDGGETKKDVIIKYQSDNHEGYLYFLQKDSYSKLSDMVCNVGNWEVSDSKLEFNFQKEMTYEQLPFTTFYFNASVIR